jgi:GDPmannose 4,6-dehydratase
MKRSIIVGCEGQDGRLLWERLRGEGGFVLGIDEGTVQTSGSLDLRSADLGPVDILSNFSVEAVVEAVRPDEIYYLAAYHQSSESLPVGDATVLEKSFAVNVRGVIHFLEAMRLRAPAARLCYAASSLVFGRPALQPQDEDTPMAPVCPYGISKAAAVQCCRFYRETHGLFAPAAILYNHESPLRRPEFVSKRIVSGAVDIRRGERAKLVLGDLEARTDWGWAPDYVDAMVRIVRHEWAEDFVVATGQPHTVREFAAESLRQVGIDWRTCVEEDPSLIRRSRQGLVGNAAKLARLTGWKPTVTFEQMVGLLVQAEEQDRQHR